MLLAIMGNAFVYGAFVEIMLFVTIGTAFAGSSPVKLEQARPLPRVRVWTGGDNNSLPGKKSRGGPVRNLLSALAVVRMRYRALALLGKHPMLYFPLIRRMPALAPLAVGPRTELVIEGFPRSGNTFSVVAFQLAQRRPVRIAHHLHAPAQVIAATKRNIPVVVLARPPADAVSSFVIREPWVGLKLALRAYIRFYSATLPYLDQCLLVSFADAVADFGKVIQSINARFRTSFEEFVHTDDNVRECFRIAEDQQRDERGYVIEERVGRPSDKRKRMKKQFVEELERPPLRSAYREAHELFDVLTGRG